MKQFCPLCERTSAGGNLYCQAIACPAEMAPSLLEPGEWLGDLEIITVVTILRSSVLYEAMHGKRKVFLKVAHPQADYTARLKREATFLQRMQVAGQTSAFLPMLLPPYVNTTVEQDAYGKTMLHNQLLTFSLFAHVEGKPLHDILTQNAQLWINHVGWITISLATAVNFLHQQAVVHLDLTPESVLVRFDTQNIPRLLLLDLGLVCDVQGVFRYWTAATTTRAYTAPELLDEDSRHIKVTYCSDVYGLGLILYQLLVGEPARSGQWRTDQEVIQAVQQNQLVPMRRAKDVGAVTKIALQTVAQNTQSRQPNCAVLAQQLINLFGDLPMPPQPWWRRRSLWLIAIVGLIIFILLTLALLLDEITV
jgi:serine/threonine protein kinase